MASRSRVRTWRARLTCHPRVVKRLLIGIAVAAAIAGFAVWWFSPTQVLKRRTRALLDTVSVAADSGRIARGIQASGIDGFLAKNVKLEVPDEEASGSWSRDGVGAGFRYVATECDFTRFELGSIESLVIGEDTATLDCWVDAEVQVDKRTRVSGRYRTEFAWKKDEGRWRITAVKMADATP
jgi:hypothetical protein